MPITLSFIVSASLITMFILIASEVLLTRYVNGRSARRLARARKARRANRASKERSSL
jgi:hypothetical protein